MLDLNISNELGPEFRKQLIDNFTIVERVITNIPSSVSEKEYDNDILQLRNTLDELREMISTMVIGSDKGDSSIEVQLARQDINGQQYKTLGRRLDNIEHALLRNGGTLDV